MQQFSIFFKDKTSESYMVTDFAKEVWMNGGFIFVSLDDDQIDAHPSSDVTKITVRNVHGTCNEN